LLLLSLLLNLALSCFFITEVVRSHRFPATAPVQRDLPALGIFRTLPSEERRAVRKVIRPHLGALRQSGKSVRTAAEAYDERLRHEPFDQEAVKAAAARLAAARQERLLLAQTIYAEALGAISPASRQRLLEARQLRNSKSTQETSDLRQQRLRPAQN
jgi:hypothetical protein